MGYYRRAGAGHVKKADIAYNYERFNGEASGNEILRLAGVARDAQTSVVVGLGGGKTLDTAKAVADELKHPVAIVPTVTSTDALSMVGGKPTIADMAIAAACEETLLTYGYSAYQAVAKHKVTPAVEAVVEANTLLSDLGFENGGLASAHAIHNGFTAIQGDIHHLTHGEKVAYGTLTHMVLEQRPDDEIARYIRFYRQIAMPTTLKAIHLENEPYENLVKVGALACSEGDTLRNLNAYLSAEDVAQAIIAVDAFSRTLAD
ncbi:hypothetical protein SODG_006634 [Sodalis praecaptivus]